AQQIHPALQTDLDRIRAFPLLPAGLDVGGAIYDVRLQIYIWKFIIKFLNNSINQLGPFCFYAIGGWLVIQGDLEIGTLMAAIAAHKDLAAPWKELLNFYQRQADAKIKYEQVREQFQPVGMMEEGRQLDEPDAIDPLSGEIAASGLSLGDDSGAVHVDGASFTFDAADHVALVGGGGSGKEETTQLLAGLLAPTSGNLQIGSRKIADLPEAVTGRRLAYVGSTAYLFSTTVRDNLLYGVQHQPLRDAEYNEDTRREYDHYLSEAKASGNSTDDLNANWIDYEAAGAADDDALLQRIFSVLKMVRLDNDIYTLGLRGTIDPATHATVSVSPPRSITERSTRMSCGLRRSAGSSSGTTSRRTRSGRGAARRAWTVQVEPLSRPLPPSIWTVWRRTNT
ncbi:MAG: ABC transporter ATP-binding protein, partial [Alphaproteobacteria bacterium]|nr:ABC transporter ATP-binding protein [Alphaproteobacteria bacterium]